MLHNNVRGAKQPLSSLSEKQEVVFWDVVTRREVKGAVIATIDVAFLMGRRGI